MRLPDSVGLRPAAASDVSLLHRIYCRTRRHELAAVHCSRTVTDGFLQQQFDVQHRYYQAHSPTNDPALAWYARLGFEPLANDGVYVELGRRAQRAAVVETC